MVHVEHEPTITVPTDRLFPWPFEPIESEEGLVQGWNPAKPLPAGWHIMNGVDNAPPLGSGIRVTDYGLTAQRSCCPSAR